jgi:hypothetical protein
MVRVPVKVPDLAGVKVTFTVQLAPPDNVPPQVLPLNPKPLAVPVPSIARLSPVKAATVPWLVTVTGIGCDACPTPVVPNCTRACGEVAIPAGRAPVPLNAVVAGAAPERIELAVSDPVIVPPEAGANSTPTVQLPPPTSAAVQVVFVGSTPNPVVAVNSRSTIPDCPEFFTVIS